MRRWLTTILLALLVLPVALRAHRSSDAYLTLDFSGEQLSGRWDIALRDLEMAANLEASDNGKITLRELLSQEKIVASYAFSHLSLRLGDIPVSLKLAETHLDSHSDGEYAVLRFGAPLPSARKPVLQISYSLLFDIDQQHHGLIRIINQEKTITGIFDRSTQAQEFVLGTPRLAAQELSFVKEGIWHIWSGFDHILFLLALLLPSVVYRQGGKWQVVEYIRPALLNVLKVVTAFTVAHSITLSLAATNTVTIESRWVEIAIALSVGVAAANNLYPVFRESAWIVAFAFGLIHGFGFAEVLKDLGLHGGPLVWALVAFNAGVEVGQFAIILVFVPIAFALRHSWFYQELTLRFGSAAITAVALAWMCERAFNFKLLRF